MGYFEAPRATDVADGIHQVTVVEADAFTGKDGAEYAKVTLRTEDGQTFDDFRSLTHPVSRQIAGENLALYGVDIDAVADFEDLALAMAELAGVTAEVGVEHNEKGYLNVKVHNTRPAGAVEEVPAEPVEPAPVPAPADDPPPF